ncbi:hypothetical protein [Nonomuraea sp. NPDC023979]|uniref:hypothetical protein n=1 Tax=Nonomuraea sp. NPDC023979 TaxID=3154796 RepID=UPI0033D101E2
MTSAYRPARAIEPGWHVRLATDSSMADVEWMPVLARVDTVTDTGQHRIWILSGHRAAVVDANALVFSRPPQDSAADLDQSPRQPRKGAR